MELDFWGTRGTCPVSGKNKVKYGGHTACASLTAPSGEVIIIDAGTGLRDLGRKLAAEHTETCPHLHLLLTHFHLDHVMGLPFFLRSIRNGPRSPFIRKPSPRRPSACWPHSWPAGFSRLTWLSCDPPGISKNFRPAAWKSGAFISAITP